jgi:uracil-DNA glycosylase family 4
MDRKHPLAKCEECPLAEERFVPSRIPRDGASLVVIGEAPGFQEATFGEPFKGPAGKLIKNVLGHYGINEKEVMFTNVVSCRPPDNATPPASAQAACSERLAGEIRDSGARDALALGGTAVNRLVDDPRKITALRVGPPKRPALRFAETSLARVVPTWHPAYCLRNPDAFPTLTADVAKLTVATPSTWVEPEWEYQDTEAEAIDALLWLEEWQSSTRRFELVVDIEVGIEKDTSFDHPNMYDMLCIGLCYDRDKAIVIGENAFKFESVREILKRILQRSKLVAQNGKFDLAGMYKYFGPLKLWFDTMLAHYVLDERPGQHGLKTMAVEMLGAPQYDDEIKQYVTGGKSYANIPRELLYKYNAYDVAVTYSIMEMLIAMLDQEVTRWPYGEERFGNLPVKTLRDVHDFLIEASNELMYVELNGITIDRDYNKWLMENYVETLFELEANIHTAAGKALKLDEPFPLNPRSPKQIMAFFGRKKISVDKTDKDTLERLSNFYRAESPMGEFLAAMLKYRFEQKRYGTFVKGIRQRMHRGRVYTTYMLHGTTSGRLASRNPNLQNITRDKHIRKQFVASKPDNVLIQCDYKQAEGRAIAWFAQDEFLRDVFADPNADLFNTIGSRLYRCAIPELTKEQRVRTKAYFYGLSFGREAFSIAKEYKLPVGEVEEDLRAFFATIPDVVRWQREVRQTVLAGIPLITPFGRMRRFSLITDQNKKDVLNEALSFLPQSTASDVCLRAFTRVRPRIRGRGFVRLTIHDALVVECADKDKEEIAAILREEMIRSAVELQTYVPFDVDTSFGRSWGEL